MFSMPLCAPIKDKINLKSTNQQFIQYNNTREQFKRWSDTSTLVNEIKSGLKLQDKKQAFDSTLSIQIDLMRDCVATNNSCPFSYQGFFRTETQINTSTKTIKEQWGIQIIMTRLNLCAFYYLGAFSSLQSLYELTAASYKDVSANAKSLTLHYQLIYNCFLQGYHPVRKLRDALPTIRLLMPKSQILQTQQDMMNIFVKIIECNLAYLKMEKHRILQQFKQCKELAFSLYLTMKQIKNQLKNKAYGVQLFLEFSTIAEIYYHILAYYFMLLEHQTEKYKQEYGFVKKQFQKMILDNKTGIKQIKKKYQILLKMKSDTNDYQFAKTVCKEIMSKTISLQNAYDIKIHQNKMKQETAEEVEARNMTRVSISQNLLHY